MGVLGLIKDIVLLPFDVALDITCITPMIRSTDQIEKDSPFGTLDRLRSIVHKLEDTKNL